MQTNTNAQNLAAMSVTNAIDPIAALTARICRRVRCRLVSYHDCVYTTVVGRLRKTKENN